MPNTKIKISAGNLCFSAIVVGFGLTVGKMLGVAVYSAASKRFGPNKTDSENARTA